jgi:hypothetical protein
MHACARFPRRLEKRRILGCRRRHPLRGCSPELLYALCKTLTWRSKISHGHSNARLAEAETRVAIITRVAKHALRWRCPSCSNASSDHWKAPTPSQLSVWSGMQLHLVQHTAAGHRQQSSDQLPVDHSSTCRPAGFDPPLGKRRSAVELLIHLGEIDLVDLLQCKAMQSSAKQSKAKQSNAKQPKAIQTWIDVTSGAADSGATWYGTLMMTNIEQFFCTLLVAPHIRLRSE